MLILDLGISRDFLSSLEGVGDDLSVDWHEEPETAVVVRRVRQGGPSVVVVGAQHGGPRVVDTLARLSRSTGHEARLVVVLERADRRTELLLRSGGAHQVLVGPAGSRELRRTVLELHRQAVDARSERDHAERRCTWGDLTVDLGRREVTVRAREVGLTRSEFELLALLAAHPLRVFTRIELSGAALGDRHASSRALESHLSRLRRKILLLDGPRVVEPVRGVGYRLAVL